MQLSTPADASSGRMRNRRDNHRDNESPRKVSQSRGEGETRSLRRSERLRRIEEALLAAGERGVTAQALAEELGVCRQTVHRDLMLLEQSNVPLWQPARGRWAVLQTRYVGSIRLTIHEAVALFFAVRLLGRMADEYNPHAVHAMRILATRFPEPVRSQAIRAAEQLSCRPRNREFVNSLEKLTIGWIERRKVKCYYHASRSRRQHVYIVHPYFLEPVGPSFAAYVLGYEETYFRDVITLKVERMSGAVLLDETFPEPEDFDAVRALENAWGIMWGHHTTRVRLRFSPEVARRVKESQWHPSQRIEELPDGGCILTLDVGHTLELEPWIRSWGPAVEVLEPDGLRQSIARQASATAALYSPSEQPKFVAVPATNGDDHRDA